MGNGIVITCAKKCIFVCVQGKFAGIVGHPDPCVRVDTKPGLWAQLIVDREYSLMRFWVVENNNVENVLAGLLFVLLSRLQMNSMGKIFEGNGLSWDKQSVRVFGWSSKLVLCIAMELTTPAVPNPVPKLLLLGFCGMIFTPNLHISSFIWTA